MLAALACPVFAAPVDVDQGNTFKPRSDLDLKTGDEAAQAGAAAAAAAHGIPILPPGLGSAAAPNTSTASTTANSANTGATATPAGAPASSSKEVATPAKPADVDLRRVVRDAAKPVLNDIANSSVGSAVRSLTSGEQLDDDAADSEDAGQRRSWNGQQGNGGADSGTGRRRTEAELANDKVKASFLFQALLQEVAPWAVAAVVLYALFYAGRLLFAMRRRIKMEKRERRRRQHDRRRANPAATSRGTPTQR